MWSRSVRAPFWGYFYWAGDADLALAAESGSGKLATAPFEYSFGFASDRSDDSYFTNRNRSRDSAFPSLCTLFYWPVSSSRTGGEGAGNAFARLRGRDTSFLAGSSFCYFLVLPRALRFFQEFNQWLGLETSWTMASYTDFALQMLVGFGLSFELPLVMVILARLGILEQRVVAEHRRHAIVALLVLAACVTPTSDPFNLGLMFVPLYGLFELGLAGMGWVAKRR